MAVENKCLTAASLLDDSPVNLVIPAVRTLVMVTPERFFRRLQTLGFNLRESGDYYGYSLPLGSVDVSLLGRVNLPS